MSLLLYEHRVHQSIVRVTRPQVITRLRRVLSPCVIARAFLLSSGGPPSSLAVCVGDLPDLLAEPLLSCYILSLVVRVVPKT